MRRASLLLLFLALAGCASVVNRPYEEISVTSDPPGAVVSVDCGDAPLYGGTTPPVIFASRPAETCGITVAEGGFAEQHNHFQRQETKTTRAKERPGGFTGALFGAGGVVITRGLPA